MIRQYHTLGNGRSRKVQTSPVAHHTIPEARTTLGHSLSKVRGHITLIALNLPGSAVWVFGDQVNDHGPYSLYLNGSTTPYASYTGRSGCGGGYAKYCEKLHGLIGFVGDLPQGNHTLVLRNQGPSDTNQTFVGQCQTVSAVSQIPKRSLCHRL